MKLDKKASEKKMKTATATTVRKTKATTTKTCKKTAQPQKRRGAGSAKSSAGSEDVLRLRVELEKTRRDRLLAQKALLEAKKRRHEDAAKLTSQEKHCATQWQHQKKHKGNWWWHAYRPGSEKARDGTPRETTA